MSTNYYKSGAWNAICDVCGFKFKSDQLRKRWDGFMVCAPDWESRHPADFLPPPATPRVLPWTRPEPTDVFISVTYGAEGEQLTSVPTGTYSPEDPNP